MSLSQRPLPDNTQHSQETEIHVPLPEFEPAIPANERPWTHALDRAACGIGTEYIQENVKYIQENVKYIQENVKYIQENVKYIQENVKYIQENVKYIQENVKYHSVAGQIRRLSTGTK